ncbi:enoyl-CoA hydratase/isomerase family protein [Burkholderia sp. Bp9142]|nr:enoyl-CoA hydratase/isomerase family protein [Burkholderia sp. Bp9142]
MTSNVDLAEVDDIAIVTMDNGGHVTTIDIPMCQGLLRALDEIADRNEHRTVILRATGKAFSAGGDLAQIFAAIDRSDNAYLDELITTYHATILAIRRLAVPVIASVHGAAAGAGFSLALACDVVVASSAARFVTGYPKLGTSTDGGLSFQLTRRLGAARAIDVLLLQDYLTAEDALSLGLVQRVCESQSLCPTTLETAEKLAHYPSAGVTEIKSLVRRISDDGLEEYLEQEKQAFIRCAQTKEFGERIAKFVQQSGGKKG